MKYTRPCFPYSLFCIRALGTDADLLPVGNIPFGSTLTPVWKQLGLLWDMKSRGLIDSKFNDF